MYLYKFKSISLLAIITLFIFSGCTRKADQNTFGRGSINSESYSESNAAKLVAAGQPEDAAEEYARIGEQLLIPGAVEYADQMFDKALNLNINNRRANLYSAFTKPIMSFKGFIPRFEKLVNDNSVKQNEVWELYFKLQNEIEKVKLPELRRFSFELPTGETPFNNYHEFQRFLRGNLMKALLDSEAKLDRIMNGDEIELYIDFEQAWQKKSGLNKEYLQNSTCVKNEKDGWSCKAPKKSSAAASSNIKVDPVDVKVLKGSMMAVVDFIRLKTAYNILGSDEAIKEIQAAYERKKAQGKKLSTRDVVRALRHYDDLFTLADDHQLPELANSVVQVLRHALDLHTMRNEICNNPHRQKRVFPSICIGLSALDSIELALDLLAGPTEILIGENEYGEPVTLYVDVTPVVQNPSKDLKDLLPTNFDYKGEPVSFPDPSMGGLFPNGDFFEKFKEVKKDRGISFTKAEK
ncbi:MAG: hypothetical protein A3F16_04740 [Deltaproteobacteria bacterium RIFCSPHIGHO2_12_FULL_43_9]|nr:MAG: hypothetical protein A3F16_04740 [Deltaproteobacteria bacterium RIFCSPHIGHO2_12_FULL_43_9]